MLWKLIANAPARSPSLVLASVAFLICSAPINSAPVPQIVNGSRGGPTAAAADTDTPLLIAGLQFSESMLPATQPDTSWYRIPAWFAGTWHRESITFTNNYEFASHTETRISQPELAAADDAEGWQKDNHGDYWSCTDAPMRSEAQGRDYRQIFLITGIKPIEVTDDHVVKQLVGTGVLIDKATGKIKYSARAKSIQTYTPVKPGLILCKSVTTEFDAHGNAIRATKAINVFHRTETFRARDFHQGKDMRVSFSRFLTLQGKSELIPRDRGNFSPPPLGSESSARTKWSGD